MSICAAFKCHNNSRKGKNKRLFSFPLNPDLAKKWAVNAQRTDLVNKDPKYLHKFYKICSDHFEFDCFYDSSRSRLRPNAIPTDFNYNTPECSQSTTLTDKHGPSVSTRKAKGNKESSIHHANLPQASGQIPVPVVLAKNIHPPLKAPRPSRQAPILVSLNSPAQSNIMQQTLQLPVSAGVPMSHTSSSIVVLSSGAVLQRVKTYSDKMVQVDHTTLSESPKTFIEKEMQTSEELLLDSPSKETLMRRKIQSLTRENACLKKNLASLGGSLDQPTIGNVASLPDVVKASKCFMPERIHEFFVSQMESFNQKSKRHQYTEELKQLLLSVYACSPDCYKLLSTSFSLPNESTLAQWKKKSGSLTLPDVCNQFMPTNEEVGETEDKEAFTFTVDDIQLNFAISSENVCKISLTTTE